MNSPKRILIIQGHPDGAAPHLCHALADAYAQGAAQSGHEVRRTDLAKLEFPLLRSHKDWEEGTLPPGLQQAQADIRWAQHLVLFFPLWLGDMPALLKAFLEQVARPGFAFVRAEKGLQLTSKGLKGKSSRVVVTMGMPATLYRWYFRAHSVKSLERNILGFVGISPVHRTLIGLAGSVNASRAARLLATMRRMG